MIRLDISALLGAAIAGALLLVAPRTLRAQSTPPPPKVFHACYVPTSGTVYRIKEVDLKQECIKSTHVPFSWTDGAGHLSSVFTVKSARATVASHTAQIMVATCPAGTQVVGGGWEIESYINNLAAPIVWLNQPSEDDSGWRVAMQNVSNNVLTYFVHVRCAK